MATATATVNGGVAPAEGAHVARPAYQAYRILHLGFTVAPILAGLDKFTNLMVDWQTYLAPVISNALPVSPHTFMMIVGVIEIIAGLLVAFKPRIGGYVVFAWLWGILLSLLVSGRHFDVAFRDFGLSLGALALARLSAEFDYR